MQWDAYYDKDLTNIATVDWEEEQWSYDLTEIFVHPNGTYYWHRASGCSCSGWGDNLYGIDDMESGTKFEVAQSLHDDLTEELKHSYHVNGIEASVYEAIAKIMKFEHDHTKGFFWLKDAKSPDQIIAEQTKLMHDKGETPSIKDFEETD